DPLMDPQFCYENVIRNTLSGSILVFHDSLKAQKNLEYCLPKILEHYSELGYSFESLSKIHVEHLELNNLNY
ncbi:MAG: hypothetical protein ABIO44_13770, partial [Saprospiraceae bacterium]